MPGGYVIISTMKYEKSGDLSIPSEQYLEQMMMMQNYS
jgi:hypothetical protein